MSDFPHLIQSYDAILVAETDLCLNYCRRRRKRSAKEKEAADNTRPIVPTQEDPSKEGYDNPYQNVDEFNRVRFYKAPRKEANEKEEKETVVAEEIAEECSGM